MLYICFAEPKPVKTTVSLPRHAPGSRHIRFADWAGTRTGKGTVEKGTEMSMSQLRLGREMLNECEKMYKNHCHLDKFILPLQINVVYLNGQLK